MRDDDIKDVVQSEALIHREAGLGMTALGRKQDETQDDVYRVSQVERTLGCVVLLARQRSLDDLIQLVNFDLVVDIAKRLSIEKEKPGLNIGRTIRHLLMKVSDSTYCASLQNNDDAGKEHATNFRV